MAFITQAVTVLQTLVIALGAGLAVLMTVIQSVRLVRDTARSHLRQ